MKIAYGFLYVDAVKVDGSFVVDRDDDLGAAFENAIPVLLPINRIMKVESHMFYKKDSSAVVGRDSKPLKLAKVFMSSGETYVATTTITELAIELGSVISIRPAGGTWKDLVEKEKKEG